MAAATPDDAGESRSAADRGAQEDVRVRYVNLPLRVGPRGEAHTDPAQALAPESSPPGVDSEPQDRPAEASSDEERYEQAYEAAVAPFDREPRDAAWAEEVESSFAAQFTSFVAGHRKVRERVSLEGVECRSSRCRVDLRYSDSRIGPQLRHDLMLQNVFFLADRCQLDSLGRHGEGQATQTIVYDCPERRAR